MRSLIALQGLVALAAAQAQSFSFGPPLPSREPTSVINVLPSATETASGPISTGRACAQISSYISRTSDYYPAVEAELAYACLKSVPIDKTTASNTINSIKEMVQFQSTLVYLKNPPSGYANDGVDIIGGLDDIDRKIKDGDYDNEYDFETDIASLLSRAHDGHLNFDGMAASGVFLWRRDPRIWLISSSENGKDIPKIWATGDVNNTERGFTPSALSKIDDKDAVQFLEEEAKLHPFHDADARYNSMFLGPASYNPGVFAFPTFRYPGPSTKVTFENGTTQEYPNIAFIVDYQAWSSVDDPQSFYETFVELSPSSFKLAKRETTQTVPRKLRPIKGVDFGSEASMLNPGYPKPFVEHSSSDVGLAGYKIETDTGTIGVLAIQTFNSETMPDIEEFQQKVEDYISESKNQGVTKHIIDLRSNGGGLVMLGYDTYLQFFPSQEPQLLSRMRAINATNIMGEEISKLPFSSRTVDLYTTPFNSHSYVDENLDAFTSWQDMFGPEHFNGDSFTNLLRYNLSDPLVSSSSRFSIGITMTGYGDRSDFKEDPFKKEDIVLLLDGFCASTCNLFTELMVQQSDVKTIAIGGRPSLGLMQPVGGTKGSLVYNYLQLSTIAADVISNLADSNSEARDWAKALPLYQGINFVDASVNMQDNIRKGLEKDGIPTQFLNDSASCRVWYERDDYLNVTRLWNKVADVAFGGKDGALDEGACIAGSVTTREAQRGLGEGSPTSPQGTAPSPSKSKGAAAAAHVSMRSEWITTVVFGIALMSSLMFGAGLI